MMPPMATVSPSAIVICVLTLRRSMLGEAMAPLAASGTLTSWLIISVTIPEAFTRGVIQRVTPVCTLVTVFVNREEPSCCAPDARACEDRVGTDAPTVIEAGMLSVAMTDGAEMMRLRPSV